MIHSKNNLYPSLLYFTCASHSVQILLIKLRQKVRIDGILSSLQVLISGVPQESILGPILFNMFLNDLLEILKNFDIYDFADDNITTVAIKNRDTLLETLKDESVSSVNQLRNNNMIVNLDKFQLMLLKKSTNKFIKAKLQININEIESENSVTLLGITIDNRLPYFKTI